MIILIGLVLLVAVVWSLADPFVGMVTLMGINMVQPGELYPIFNALHVERLEAIVALVVLFARGYRFAYPRVTRKVLWFFAAVVASIPLSFWVSNSISSAEDFGKIVLLHLLLVAVVISRQRLRVLLLTLSMLVGYLSVSSLALYFQGKFDHTMGVDRIMGLTGASNSPDTLGLTIATALPIMYLFTLKPSRIPLRLLMWGLIALSLWTLLLTGSRGSLLSFLLMLVLAMCISRKRMILIPTVAVLAMVVWSALPMQYKARYMTLSDPTKEATTDMSYTNRLLSWEGGWHMFLHNPLTGIGIGNYGEANDAIYWPAPKRVWLDAHSLYFKVLGELGLFGVITFFGMVTVLFKTNNQVRRRLIDIETRARAGIGEAVPRWLRLLPTASNLSVIGLLYCGYAYHDLYRSTWYFLAGVAGAMDLITAKELALVESSVADTSSAAAAAPLPAAAHLGVPA